MRIKILSVISIVLLVLLSSAAGFQDDFPVLRGPYFGQRPPGMNPVLFAPSIMSADMPAFCSVFSPCGTEFYFVSDSEDGETSDIMWMRKKDNVWTEPEPAPFNSKHIDNDICMTPDGYRVFWRSWRPLPGHDKPEDRSFIWFSYRTKRGWSEALPVECGDTFLQAGYPSITYNGTLYFPFRSEANVGESDIHFARFIGGKFGTPVNLGRSVNTQYIEGDMCVAPDESFLVVSCWNRPDNNGESDLYISFRGKDGLWSALKNIGKPVNNEHNENCPMISPDGKYFFFFRYDGKQCRTYWVDVRILEKLR